MIKHIAFAFALLLAGFAHADGATGVFINALTNPDFPVKKAAKVLAASPRPALAFLHKSFGSDTGNLRQVLSLLLVTKSTVHVVVYGDCGPCRPPRRPKGLFRLIAPKETVSSLNEKLARRAPRVMYAFAKEWGNLERYLPFLPGVRYTFIESLEDNLTPRAHRALRRVALHTFAHRTDISYARNPLRPIRDYQGRLEVHSYSLDALRSLKPGDIINGDGQTFCFEGEAHCSGYSEQQIRRWVLLAREMGVMALVYRPEIQGLPVGLGDRPLFLAPEDRTYRISHAERLKQLIK